jgi:hypothetical protein
MVVSIKSEERGKKCRRVSTSILKRLNFVNFYGRFLKVRWKIFGAKQNPNLFLYF